jgi:hypothetical protein
MRILALAAILPAIPFWRWKLAKKKADPDQWEMLQN